MISYLFKVQNLFSCKRKLFSDLMGLVTSKKNSALVWISSETSLTWVRIQVQVVYLESDSSKHW